jgi:hypothetical protein
MKLISKISLFVLIACLSTPVQAIDINLLNVNIGSPEGQKLSGLYGDSFGFTPQQTSPALLGPAEETPIIMKIAQAAGTVPMTVWMMRKMGMSYSRILSTFALAPSALLGGSPGATPPFGTLSPSWASFADPFLIQMARVYFLKDILKISPTYLSLLPVMGPQFSYALLRPYHPVHGFWMPPGIAKKYGLWMPPGQQKKIGLEDHGHPHNKHKGHPGWGKKDGFGKHKYEANKAGFGKGPQKF